MTHISRVDVSLDNIQDGDVAGGFARNGGNHPVLRLQQTSHNIKDCRPSYRLRLGGYENQRQNHVENIPCQSDHL